jgi:integrase
VGKTIDPEPDGSRSESVKLNFTKARIEALPTPKAGRTAYRDDKTRGLGVLVQPTGTKSFFWFRKVRGKPRWETIGAHLDLTVEQARTRAGELNSKLALWKAHNYESESPFEQRGALTFDGLVEDYILKHLREHAKNPPSAEGRLRWTLAHYLADFRNRQLNAIRREDVDALHRKIGAKHHRTANAVVKQIRTLYNFATKNRHFRGENPARHITFYHEPKRARFLQPDELPAFWAALAKSPNLDFIDFANLALWTGARKSNVLEMRWQDTSLEDNRWTIPDPKNRKPYTVPLTPEAVSILKRRRRYRLADNPWVFPGRGKSGHITDYKKRWKELLKTAGLDYPGQPERRITQHDLRRTQGAYLAAQGTSMKIISEMLGHASMATTAATYTPMQLDAVRAAVEPVNRLLAAYKRKKPKMLPPAPKSAKAARRG